MKDVQRELQSKGIILTSAEELHPDEITPFSVSVDGLEGTGKTTFALGFPRPLILVNFGDRSANLLLYDLPEEKRRDVYICDIQPASPEGWTYQEAVQSLLTLNQVIREAAPRLKNGTFVLDGGSSWWSVMQQVFVEPKEKERIAAGKKSIGGIIYEEANNRVRGIISYIKACGCFLVLTHQLKQNWDSDGPIPGSYSPRKNSQTPYLVEVEVELSKVCRSCSAPACTNPEHIGRKHLARIKKLSGNTGLEGLVVENLTFETLYTMQTGRPYPGKKGDAEQRIDD
jgi:hypothetical protein